MGLIRQREGKVDEATSYYREALRSDPTSVDAHNNLGVVLAQQGLASEALPHFLEAVKLKPSFAKANQNLGLTLEALQQTREAVDAYRESLRYAPDAHDVARRLAFVLATDPDDGVRNGAEAVRLATAVSAASGDADPSDLGVLAAAFAEAGRFDGAVRAQERVLRLARDAATADARRNAEARLALYRAGQPYRSRAQ